MTPPGPALPTGTVTFLRTDVEGSMRLAAAMGSGWDELNAVQLALIRAQVEAHRGVVVRTEGDAVFGVFDDAGRAVAAAIDIQRALAGHDWPPDAVVRVRVGLHSGEAHLAGDDYGGFDVGRAARIAAVGSGGQIVLSDPTRALVTTALPDGASIRDLGRHVLKDVPYPEHLFQLDVPGLPSAFPPIRSRLTTAGNLPPRLTSFVGREYELAEARRLLADGRLLTITGPGGIGKTSLAVELARAVAPEFGDGAWFVALESVPDPGRVAAAVARVLGVYEGPERPIDEGVRRHLADREALLVLDNFEHLLDAAGFVSGLLMAAASLRILVTSRAPLRIHGEQEYPARPLEGEGDGPDATPPALRLFFDRARAARPGWDPGGDVAVVRDICRLLDDLPLGIELAAGRVALLPPIAIRDRLLARLPLPGSGPRDAPGRQQTLDAAIAWSHDLLDDGQKRLLRRLAVFEHGFDLDQAQQVAGGTGDGGDILDAVIELADRSLLVRDVGFDTGARIGGLRFRMLETIRTFSLRQLASSGEEEQVRGRHAAAFLALAEEAARHIPSGDQARWLDRLGEDHANLRAAIEWAIEHGPVETAQRLAAALWRYWQFGGFLNEARGIVDRVAALAPDEPSPARMWAVAAAAGISYWQADSQRAHALYQEQLLLAEQIGDEAGMADAIYNLSATSFITGGIDESRRLVREARQRYERLGDDVGAARTYWGEQNVAMYQGDAAGVRELLRDTIARFEANNDVMYQGLAAGAMAFLEIFDKNHREALYWGARSMATHHAIRDTATTTINLAAAAIILIDLDRAHEAAVLLGAFEGLSERSGVKPPAGLGFMIELLRPVERTIDALHADEYAAANAAGRQMSLDEAVAFTLETFDRVAKER